MSIDIELGDLRTCCICFENKESKDVSYCENCNDSGITCYVCEKAWAQQSNDPSICSICKQNTKKKYIRRIHSYIS